MFFKESNTDFTEFVLGSRKLTSRGRLPYAEVMKPYFQLIQTPPYLIAEPKIVQHTIEGKDRFLVMASDGLWAMKEVTDQWVVEMVQKALENNVDPAQHLLKEVHQFKPGDDITIVVAVLPKSDAAAGQQNAVETAAHGN